MTGTHTEHDPPVKARRRRRWPRILGAVLLAIAVIATPFVYNYRRQIWSYATHWKGSPTHTVGYRHLPTPELHVAVAGDVGDSGTRVDETGRAVARIDRSSPYQALFLLGDNAYPDGDPRLLPGAVFQPFAEVLDHAKLLAILGNHDVMNGNARAQVRVLGMPGRWWSQSMGDTLFVGLDSNDINNPKQRRFLEQTLARSNAPWKVVALHHPPYSAGYQGSNTEARRVFSPIFECYGVQLVLSGHDHDYQRSERINGVTYLVSGAASGTRRTGEESFTGAIVLVASLRRSRVLPRPDRGTRRQPEQSGRRHLRAPQPDAAGLAPEFAALLVVSRGAGIGGS